MLSYPWYVYLLGAAVLFFVFAYFGIWPFARPVRPTLKLSDIPEESDMKRRSRRAGKDLLDVHKDQQTLTQLDAAANGGLAALDAKNA